MYMMFRPRNDTMVNVLAMDLNETGTADLRKIDRDQIPRFMHYIVASAEYLKKFNNGQALSGFDAVLTSTIPNGGGVSSSSALSVVSASAFVRSNSHNLNKMSKHEFLMVVCESEWAWSGVRGGIMDQYASINAQAGRAFVLDCRTSDVHPDFDHIPLPSDLSLIIANTNVKHDLVGTPYNDRRAACERAAAAVQKLHSSKKITHLRDVTMKMLDGAKSTMDAEAYQRAVHAINEDVRTVECGKALKRGDLKTAGKLVNESHESLSKIYEVSCDELDAMVDVARAHKGTYGARMMGGGFGGCCIVLADPSQVDDLIAHLNKGYKERTGRDASILETKPGSGFNVGSMGLLHAIASKL